MVRFTDDSGSIKNGTQPASMYHVNEGKSKKLKPQCPGLQKVCIPKISQSHRETMLYDNQKQETYSGSYQIRVDQDKINITSVQLYFGRQEEGQNGGKTLYVFTTLQGQIVKMGCCV